MKPEYVICKALSTYLRLQYPEVEYHFDLAGLNLSKAQAGMTKALQKRRGFSDLFVMEPRGVYHGLFVEVKADSVRIFKKDGSPADERIAAQVEFIELMKARGYRATFAKGFDECKKAVDDYMALPVFKVEITGLGKVIAG